MAGSRPPFRADQVGSLLRPERLLKARVDRRQGAINAGELAALEDECIREVVRQQEAIGLHAITDGDFRRFMFHIDFLTSVDVRSAQSAPRSGLSAAAVPSASGVHFASVRSRPRIPALFAPGSRPNPVQGPVASGSRHGT